MSEKRTPYPAAGTLPYLLLAVVALSGEFPTAQVARLPGSETYKANMIVRLKSENRLYAYYHNSLRGLRLTAASKRELLQIHPERFDKALSGKSIINAPKYSLPNRLRLHRMAEVLVTMLNANVAAFPWEKPDIFTLGSRNLIMRPAYYNSVEVKDMGEEGNKIRNSRATGLLLAPSAVYAVYNTADSEMKWEFQSEMRLKVTIQTDICGKLLSDQYGSVTPEAVIFGSDMEQMSVLSGPAKSGRKPFLAGAAFDHFYYLTSDHRGEVILQLLCDAAKKHELDALLMEDLTPGKDYFTENDGFDEDGAPVLFGYTCDLPRIHRFHTGLECNHLKGTIVCFDFQKEVFRRVCGPEVSFQIIDFDTYERKMFHLSRKTD